jgi:hypothetical protein
MRVLSVLPATVSLLLGLIAAAPLASARSPITALEPAGSGPRPTSECEALYGSAARRVANAKARQRIYWVQEELEGITVAHSSESWTDPVEVEVKGVRLVAAREGLATVRVSPALAGALGCVPGEYRVGPDDELGRAGRVLSVHRSAVLLERGGQLAYLRLPGARAPRWLVAWSAPGTVLVPQGQPTTVGLPSRVDYERY